MQTYHTDVAIVGAGIVGLAHALAAARQGLSVVVFERDTRAVGASIRNFGLVWPIGQPAGHLYERALRSRAIWLEALQGSGCWYAPAGSLHLAYHADEQDALLEYLATTPSAQEAGCRILTPAEVAQRSSTARTDGLQVALWSPTEVNIDPREAIAALPHWLHDTYNITFRFGTPVKGVTTGRLEVLGETWHAERIFVCSGNDFETLYPTVFREQEFTRCKLQMLRTVRQPATWQLGPCLCAGLTLLHYKAFSHCTSLAALRERLTEQMPWYLNNGIHVLLSQTRFAELTIGDNHDYAWSHDPFTYEQIDDAIMTYLATFAQMPQPAIAERWVGIYPVLRGKTEFVHEIEPGVTLVNGLGGAGMTLSFGLAEEVLTGTYPYNDETIIAS